MPRKNVRSRIARIVLVALVVGLLGGLLAQASPLTARPVAVAPATADSFASAVWGWVNQHLQAILHLGAPPSTVSIQKDGGSPDNNVSAKGYNYGIPGPINP